MSVPEDSSTVESQLRSIPLFENLDARFMKQLLKGAKRRPYARGTNLVRQGDYSSAFYVVLQGMVTAYRTEPDGETEIVGVRGAGDWFGESSALSHQPHFATARVDAPSVMLELDDVVFQSIYRGGGTFAKLVDQRYRERALEVHLRTAPLLKGAPPDVLKLIAKGARLVTFAAGKKIARDGDDADAIFLIRSGVVKQVVDDAGSGEQRIQAYFCDNSSFGEQALTDDRRFRGAFVAMTRVDVVELSRTLFDEISSADQNAGRALRQRALQLARDAEGEATELLDEEALDLMVNRKAVVGGRALVIDLRRCTRCNACVESCSAVHEDGVPRINKRGIRAGDSMLTSACYHCKIPECMLSCNFGAIRRDLKGGIDFILDNCTGCTACEEKCPYGVISMAELADAEQGVEPGAARSLVSKIPVLGKLFRSDTTERERDEPRPTRSTKAIKCDLCAGLPFEACVYNCPCAAISRIAPDDLIRDGMFED